MIIQEGAKVLIGGDNKGLLRTLSSSKLAVAGFATAAGAALLSVAVQSAKMAAALDKDLRLVATLGGEAADSTVRLRDEVKALGREFGKDFNELATANYQAVSGGFKTIGESMKIVRAGTKLAIASNTGLVKSTESVVKVLNAFGKGARQANKTAAQLWAVSRDGIVTVDQLGRFLKSLPAAAAASDISFLELGAALSTMTSITGSASEAVDQLRTGIIKMEQLGLEGSFLDRIETFVGKDLGELTTLLGSDVAALGILTLAENIDILRVNTDAAGSVVGDFNRAVEGMAGSATTASERIQASFGSLMEDLGVNIGQALPLLAAMANGMDALASASSGISSIALTKQELEAAGFDAGGGATAGAFADGRGASGFAAGQAAAAARRNGGFSLDRAASELSLQRAIASELGVKAPTAAEFVKAIQEGTTVALRQRMLQLSDKTFGQLLLGSPIAGGIAPFDGKDGPSIGGTLGGAGQFNSIFSPPESDISGLTQGHLGRLDFDEFGPRANPDTVGFSFKDFNKRNGIGGVDKELKRLSASSLIAQSAVGGLTSMLLGPLNSALTSSNSAFGNFISGILSTVAQLGVNSLLSSFIPGFGGGLLPTLFGGGGGSSELTAAGIQSNDLAFNPSTLGGGGSGPSMERLAAIAASGAPIEVHLNQNIGGGDPGVIGRVTAAAVQEGIRDARISGTERLFKKLGR